MKIGITAHPANSTTENMLLESAIDWLKNLLYLILVGSIMGVP